MTICNSVIHIVYIVNTCINNDYEVLIKLNTCDCCFFSVNPAIRNLYISNLEFYKNYLLELEMGLPIISAIS